MRKVSNQFAMQCAIQDMKQSTPKSQLHLHLIKSRKLPFNQIPLNIITLSENNKAVRY